MLKKPASVVLATPYESIECEIMVALVSEPNILVGRSSVTLARGVRCHETNIFLVLATHGETSAMVRLLKQVVNEAAGEKNTGGVLSGVR